MGLFDKLLASSDKAFEKKSLSASEQFLADRAETDVKETAAKFAEMTKPAAELLYIDGISSMTPMERVTVFADCEKRRLAVTSASTGRSVYIKYSQLCAAGIIKDTDIVAKNKSVIGRAAVGGLVLGPVGAIVGGLSGTGAKQGTVAKYYYVVNYHPSTAPTDVAAVKFAIPGMPDEVYNLNTAVQAVFPSEETDEYL